MKRLLIIISVSLVPFILLDIFRHDAHGDFFWSGVPAFFSLFGLIGCLIIILVSKWLGHYWLQRREGYYEDNDAE